MHPGPDAICDGDASELVQVKAKRRAKRGEAAPRAAQTTHHLLVVVLGACIC